MSPAAVAEVYKKGLAELDSIVSVTELEVISGRNNVLLQANNINFFTKSFLISACAHLEMCVKDVVFEVARDVDTRLTSASIPSAIVEWRLSQKKRSDPASGSVRLSIGMTKKEVDDLVSGNVYRTKEALLLVGVDLAADVSAWEVWKDRIQTIVTRRNNIVHHNDDASDVSLGDVRSNIASILVYIDFIVSACGS